MGLWGRLHPENVAEGGRLIDKGTENGAIAGFRVRTSSAARGPLIAHLYDLGERGFRLVGLERTD